jgi:hypothetical protein
VLRRKDSATFIYIFVYLRILKKCDCNLHNLRALLFASEFDKYGQVGGEVIHVITSLTINVKVNPVGGPNSSGYTETLSCVCNTYDTCRLS